MDCQTRSTGLWCFYRPDKQRGIPGRTWPSVGVYFETGVFIQATGKNPHAYTTAKTPFLSVTCLHGAGTLGTNCSSSLFNLACQQHEESQTITLSPPTYLYFIRGKNQSLAPIFIFVMLPVSVDPGLMDFSPYVHENTFSRGKALPVGKDSLRAKIVHINSFATGRNALNISYCPTLLLWEIPAHSTTVKMYWSSKEYVRKCYFNK